MALIGICGLQWCQGGDVFQGLIHNLRNERCLGRSESKETGRKGIGRLGPSTGTLITTKLCVLTIRSWEEKAFIYRICQIAFCKNTHHGQFLVTNIIPLNLFGIELYNQLGSNRPLPWRDFFWLSPRAITLDWFHWVTPLPSSTMIRALTHLYTLTYLL